MNVGLVGISHKTAPVEVRERLAFTDVELAETLPVLRLRFGPVVVLSTCNRTEIYVRGDGQYAPDVHDVGSFLASLRGLPQASEDAYFYYLAEAEAVGHLFRVAAGIESMVLGEVQILGQVRDALLASERAGATDPLLSRLFQSAVGVGRKARASTGIGNYVASVSSIAVDLARRELGALTHHTVLVVSTGEAGKLTARSLREAGVARILVTGRTFGRAENLARELGGSALPFDELADGLAQADIVICATGARGFQIDRSFVESAMARRPERPLFLIDLAVPRDVDPSVRDIAGVMLHDIDSLQAEGEEAAPARSRAIEQAQMFVDGEVRRFMAWWQGRRAVPTISALRQQAEDIRRAELAKTLDRLPNLSSDERDRIEALTAAIVKKLLHQPITRLKESDHDPRYLDTVRDLFALQAGVGD